MDWSIGCVSRSVDDHSSTNLVQALFVNRGLFVCLLEYGPVVLAIVRAVQRHVTFGQCILTLGIAWLAVIDCTGIDVLGADTRIVHDPGAICTPTIDAAMCGTQFPADSKIFVGTTQGKTTAKVD